MWPEWEALWLAVLGGLVTAFCLRSRFKDSAIDIGVDVAAGEDSSNSLAGDLCVLLKQCCECCRPCAFRYVVVARK